jgi:enediyne core biosynthesis thioesterase
MLSRMQAALGKSAAIPFKAVPLAQCKGITLNAILCTNKELPLWPLIAAFTNLRFKETIMLNASSTHEHSSASSVPSFNHGYAEQIIIPQERHDKQTFEHNIDIYLKESNAYGNTYFARYFEWQGVCRERWFHRCISADMLQNQGVFITKRAHQDYMQETFPFQTVQCEVNTFEVKSCSFYLLFRFLVDGKLVSHGYQQILFASHDKKIQRLPEAILKKVRAYELPSCEWMH